MRISDWSSDVCSSDLRGFDGLARIGRRGKAPIDTPEARGIIVAAHRQQCAADDAIGRQSVQDRPEIGRASCRERVCQYVENSVVDVAFKKKTKRKKYTHKTNEAKTNTNTKI